MNNDCCVATSNLSKPRNYQELSLSGRLDNGFVDEKNIARVKFAEAIHAMSALWTPVPKMCDAYVIGKLSQLGHITLLCNCHRQILNLDKFCFVLTTNSANIKL